jgi:hypothetical protein
VTVDHEVDFAFMFMLAAAHGLSGGTTIDPLFSPLVVGFSNVDCLG